MPKVIPLSNRDTIRIYPPIQNLKLKQVYTDGEIRRMYNCEKDPCPCDQTCLVSDWYGEYENGQWVVWEEKTSSNIPHSFTQLKYTIRKLRENGHKVDHVALIYEHLNLRDAKLYKRKNNKLYSTVLQGGILKIDNYPLWVFKKSDLKRRKMR